jgi:adenylate cyclase
MVDMQQVEQVFAWLCAGAPPPTGIRHSLAKGLERMHAAGVPIDRFALFVQTIHPTVRGRRISWSPGEETEVREVPHGFFETPLYLESPIAQVFTKGKPLRRRLDGDDDLGFEHLEEMRASGFTDYLALPLPMANGEMYGVSWSTRQAGGFGEDGIAALERINPILARLIETYILRLNTASILSTYVGRNAGAKVLNGKIVRGDAEAIRAAILYADLKGFTALSNDRPAEEVLATLNAFFEALDPEITSRGGEILKFMGDGVLAIFPTAEAEGERRRAVDAALAAVKAARTTLEAAPDAPGFRASINLGDVHYGNIGSQSRLDFTVIGPAVNLGARLLSAGGAVDADTVCSEEVANLLGGGRRLGEVEMKGFPAPQPLYALD